MCKVWPRAFEREAIPVVANNGCHPLTWVGQLTHKLGVHTRGSYMDVYIQPLIGTAVFQTERPSLTRPLFVREALLP